MQQCYIDMYKSHSENNIIYTCFVSLWQTILFTTDENILEAVSKNDDAYEGDMLDDSEPDDVPFERPSTADGGSDEVQSILGN